MADYIDREAVIRDIDSRIKNYQEMGDRISTISLKFAMGVDFMRGKNERKC